MGFTRWDGCPPSRALLPHDFNLTCAPCGAIGGMFLLHFPSPWVQGKPHTYSAQVLPGILP